LTFEETAEIAESLTYSRAKRLIARYVKQSIDNASNVDAIGDMIDRMQNAVYLTKTQMERRKKWYRNHHGNSSLGSNLNSDSDNVAVSVKDGTKDDGDIGR